MNPLKANYKAEGYKMGMKHALAGKEKNFEYSWKKFKLGLKFFNSKIAMETFRLGYDTGHQAGLMVDIQMARIVKVTRLKLIKL